MRYIPLLIFCLVLSACGQYEVKNLVKSDVDLVADEFISETRSSVRLLLVKLYKRNPAELSKNPGMTIPTRNRPTENSPKAARRTPRADGGIMIASPPEPRIGPNVIDLE